MLTVRKSENGNQTANLRFLKAASNQKLQWPNNTLVHNSSVDLRSLYCQCFSVCSVLSMFCCSHGSLLYASMPGAVYCVWTMSCRLVGRLQLSATSAQCQHAQPRVILGSIHWCINIFFLTVLKKSLNHARIQWIQENWQLRLWQPAFSPSQEWNDTLVACMNASAWPCLIQSMGRQLHVVADDIDLETKSNSHLLSLKKASACRGGETIANTTSTSQILGELIPVAISSQSSSQSQSGRGLSSTQVPPAGSAEKSSQSPM